jgi:predicted lipoprotein with Yx(FWY)xxD motif
MISAGIVAPSFLGTEQNRTGPGRRTRAGGFPETHQEVLTMFGRRFALALLAVIALTLGACSASTTGGTAQPSTQAPTPAASPAATPEESPTAGESESAEGGEDYPLAVATVSAGQTLTGEDGKTLYIFKMDTKDSGKSVCNGDCATTWPPYVLEDGEEIKAEDGVTGTITMITRDDGAKQVAYNGWPLYYFKNDAAAGDANGQGLNDVWFIANP